MISEINTSKLSNSTCFENKTIIKLQNFINIDCDIIDDEEYWSIDVSTPIIEIINNAEFKKFDEQNYTYLIANTKNLEEIITCLHEYFKQYLHNKTSYDVLHNRYSEKDISKYLNIVNDYSNYKNTIVDYTKKIYWNKNRKTIENI